VRSLDGSSQGQRQVMLIVLAMELFRSETLIMGCILAFSSWMMPWKRKKHS